MRLIKAGLLAALVLFPLFGYTFVEGAKYGVQQYKHSKEFVLVLFSMYRFGIWDACKDHRLCGR